MSLTDPAGSLSAPPPGANGAGGTAGWLETRDLTASYRSHVAVTGVDLALAPRKITAIIGPSGCGKSTVLRCMNGLHLTVPGASVTGTVILDGVDIYNGGVDLVQVRKHVGMVFQRPNPFPTMSIAANVSAGLRFTPRRQRHKARHDEIVEQSLIQAGLWEEVKDRLHKPGGSLSGGQQQRLCIARALAVQPQILLMDEPCSALDPVSTLIIEDLMGQLKQELTVVIVTHNMQQAHRVSDVTAFMTVDGPGRPGRLVEVSPTKELFSKPSDQATIDYITGKVG